MSTPPFHPDAQAFRPMPDDPGEWCSWADALPVTRALGVEVVEVTPGRLVGDLPGSVWPLNPNGSVHGGLVLGVADHLMGCAAMTVMEPGMICATATLGGHFLRPAIGPLRYEVDVERAGRHLAFLRLTVTNGDGRPCHTATGSWSIGRRPPGLD